MGRGEGVKEEDSKRGRKSLEMRLDTGHGSQSTWTSSRRARLVRSEAVEGTQDRKEGREGVNDTFLGEGRPGQEEKDGE